MISVVVPTMWKYSPFLDFISYVVRNEVVSEVIIINNNATATPNHHILTHPKVKLFDPGRNIFVNPAWNFGIAVSAENKVCILNDDIIFDLKLFYKVDDFLNESIGSIGLNAGIVEMKQTPVTNGEIIFEPYTNQMCYGFGNLMFIHKAHWRPIPQGLDVWYGDNYIFDYYFFKGFQNYFISNMLHHHESSTTVNTVFQERREIEIRERNIYDQVKQKLISREYYN